MALCDASTTGFEYLIQFEFIKAVSCTYFSAAGALVTGLLVYGAIASALYVRTGSVMIPLGLLFLTGGAATPMIAGIASPIIAVVLFLAGGGVFAYLYYKYSL